MSERFQYLSIKYIDGNLSSNESNELIALVKGNLALQKELAEMLVQDAAIQNVLGAQSQMEKEAENSGGLKLHSSNPKHNSRRFQPTKKQSPWPMLAVAALVFLGLAIPGFLYKKSLDEVKGKNINGQNIVGNKQIQANVTAIIGQVYKVQNGIKEKLVKGDGVNVGDSIESDSNSYAAFKTNAKSAIYLNEQSKFIWNENSLDLKQGALYSEINKKDVLAVYQLTSPGSCRIAITGTAFEWSYLNNNAELKVKEGMVEFYKGLEKKVVVQNQSISESDFEKGVQSININAIATWLKYIKSGFIYIDEFDGENYNSFWSLKASQASSQSSPLKGLFCSGKGQKTELISKEIELDGIRPLSVLFKTKSIKASNSFEYGYEIWGDNNLLLKQGYAVTQIDLNSYHIKEIRNVSNAKDQLDQVKSKDGSLPDIEFGLTLNASEKIIANKIDYKNGNILSDVVIGTKLNKLKIVFYLETINDLSQAQWIFRGFAFGYGESEASDEEIEKLLKWKKK